MPKTPCVNWPFAEGIFCGVSSGGGSGRYVARATPGAIVVAIIRDRATGLLRLPACLVKKDSQAGI